MTIPNIPIGEGINYPIPDSSSPKIHTSSPVKTQISLGSSQKVGIQFVDDQGKKANVDNIVLRIYAGDTLIVTYENIENPEVGIFEVALGSPATNSKRDLTLVWSYEKDGVEQELTDHAIVVDRMPTYESLSDKEKQVVEQVSWMFDDLFDSTEGGAFLSENFQTHFNNERLAQLAFRALQKINVSAQPTTSYGFGSIYGGKTLPAKYHSVLVSATYLEVLRHLIRSYVEIPEFRNMSTTYTDRRDYMQRWRGILDEEKEDVATAVTLMKRDHLNLGGGALIVSGGYYGSGGRGGGYFSSSGSHLTRGWRMYPTAPLTRM